MLVTLDPSDSRPLYLQIEDEVKRAIVVGALEPDDALPSVRELASDLVVNPRTVRQAYQELERDGVVYVKRGLGTFVAPDALSAAEERRSLGRQVAKRALLEARRNGLGVEDLLVLIREVANEEAQHLESATKQSEGEA